MSGWPFLNLTEAAAWVGERVVGPALAGKVRVERRTDPSTGRPREVYREVGWFTINAEATATLRAALARGELVATGTAAATGAEEPIPAAFWPTAVVDATGLHPGRPEGRACRPNGSTPWRSIRIDARQLEEAWPSTPTESGDAPPAEVVGPG